MFKDIMAPHITPLAPLPSPIQAKTDLTFPVRAILFDIYGTLLISASGDISTAEKNLPTAEKLEALLDKYKISIPPSQLKTKLFQVIESDHADKKNQGIDFPEVNIDKVWQQVLEFKEIDIARCFAVEYEMIVNPVYPMPLLGPTLQTLKRKNIPMGIISNAQFFTPLLFDLFLGALPEKLGFDPDLIFYSYQYGYAKPSLFLFDQAVKSLARKGIKPGDVLYIGNDMLNDIYPSDKIGFRTCLFAGDSRSLRLRQDDPRCKSLIPDAVIKELNQLTDMIRSS